MKFLKQNNTLEFKDDFNIIEIHKNISKLQKNMLSIMETLLDNKKFDYIYIPSLISETTIKTQDINITPIYTIYPDSNYVLSGSAEQGILELFSGKYVEPHNIYSINQCFRNENYYSYVRKQEFLKLEQFIFCYEQDWESMFKEVLTNAEDILNYYKIEYRIIDVTERDDGYHILKKDIEIKTKKYGWLETHSCSYFGNMQANKFNIKGKLWPIVTISCTGLAFPRMLIPFIEKNYSFILDNDI